MGCALRDYMEPGLTWDATRGVNGVMVYFVPSDKALDSMDGWSRLAVGLGVTAAKTKTDEGATCTGGGTGKEAHTTAGSKQPRFVCKAHAVVSGSKCSVDVGG